MKKKLILLFLIAFAVRAVFCLSYNIAELYPDVLGYHMYAFNLIDNGYYSPFQSPEEDTFFREPAVPYILKASYQLASFFGVNICPISNYSMTHYAVLENHPEFYWGRLMFSFIDSVSICFFFLTLLYFTTQKKAMVVTVVYLLFLPCFFFLQTLLRDSFQVSLLLILNYFFVRYLFSGSRFSLLIVGGLLGIAILTLKALAVIGVGIIVFMFVAYRKSPRKFFIDAILVTVVSCLTITPWMIKVYNSYPSICTFKELGTSLTFDFKMNKFVSPLFILLSVLGFWGFWIYFRTYWKGTMIYVCFMITLVFLPSFGDEGRRLLLFYSAWIPFFLLLVSNICFYFRRKIRHAYDK